MISLKEAKQKLFDHGQQLLVSQKENISLANSLGRVTAEAVNAPLSNPLFDNSAMDGFALRHEDTSKAHSDHPVGLKIIGECQAGNPPQKLQSPNTTIRIMTGAPIPSGANAVVMQEKVTEQDGLITLQAPVQKDQNIRRAGEDIRSGEMALDKGQVITGGTMSFLASIGVTQLAVTAQPKVSILVTGSELVSEPNEIKPGQILESNSLFLKAALHELGLAPLRVQLVGDNPQRLQEHLEACLEDSDIVILTGGVSVGAYDFTKKILGDLGVQTLFWRVNQKPGKPLYVGSSGKRIFFGLPGNPYAVLFCFYIYVRPYLLQFMHHPRTELTHSKMPLHETWVKKDTKTHFLKGRIMHQDGQHYVQPLSGQGSHLMRALSQADVLISIDGEPRSLSQGELVDVIHLP